MSSPLPHQARPRPEISLFVSSNAHPFAYLVDHSYHGEMRMGAFAGLFTLALLLTGCASPDLSEEQSADRRNHVHKKGKRSHVLTTYSITGRVGFKGRGLVIDYGSVDGARKNDTVFVYNEGNCIAQLCLLMVEPRYSVASIVEDTQVAPIEEHHNVVRVQRIE